MARLPPNPAARAGRRTLVRSTTCRPLQLAAVHDAGPPHPRSTARPRGRRVAVGVPAVAVLAVLAVLSGGCGRVGGDPFQPTSNTPLRLDDGERLGQTIDPDGAISAVAVNVATFDAPPDPDGVLTVTLSRLAGGGGAPEVLGEADVAGADLVDGGWAAAAFPAPVAVDGVALVEITWTGSTPLALWANRTQEGTRGIANDPYAGGQLVLDGQPAAGDLAFRVTGPAGAGEAVAQVAEVLRSTAARSADDPVFAVGWVLALAGALALAVRGLRTR
jgi:hypothetical protein